MARPLARERDGERGEPEVGDGRMGQGLEHLERRRLLRVDDVRDVRHGRRRHARLPELLVPLARVALAKALREDRDELVAVPNAVRVRAEPGVVDELGQPDHVAYGGEEPVVAARDHELAVARRKHLVRGDHRKDGSLAHGDGAVGEVADEVVADVRERGLVERRVDDRSLAGPLALEERRRDPDRRPHPRAHVDQRRADAHTGPSRLAGHADEAARRLHERVVPGLLAQRPDAPVRADRAVDEPRVAVPDGVLAEAEPVGEAGPQALEENVRPFAEAQHGIAAALVGERDGE